jgi:cysteine desulfurase
MNRPIYLDHNATTPLDPEVKAAIIHALDIFGNPSSAHLFGREARAVIDRSRQSVAELLNCSPDEVLFTSGGTESNNLAIFGVAFKKGKGHIISTCIEHPAVLNPLQRLQRQGFRVTYLPVNSRGIVEIEQVKKAITKDTILITVMHSNNETGMIQPIREIGSIARQRGIIFHSDASQSVGKIPVDVSDLSVDLLTVAGHKFYGPKGVGALYMRKGIAIEPPVLGAGHERGLRPGTENILGIAGLGKACEVAKRELKRWIQHNLSLTKILYEGITSRVEAGLNGAIEGRLPNTLNISIKGIKGYEFVEILKDEVAFSAGSACHSGQCMPSSVLIAMGLTEAEALSAIRLSTGKDNTTEEVLTALDLVVTKILKIAL